MVYHPSLPYIVTSEDLRKNNTEDYVLALEFTLLTINR